MSSNPLGRWRGYDSIIDAAIGLGFPLTISTPVVDWAAPIATSIPWTGWFPARPGFTFYPTSLIAQIQTLSGAFGSTNGQFFAGTSPQDNLFNAAVPVATLNTLIAGNPPAGTGPRNTRFVLGIVQNRPQLPLDGSIPNIVIQTPTPAGTVALVVCHLVGVIRPTL